MKKALKRPLFYFIPAVALVMFMGVLMSKAFVEKGGVYFIIPVILAAFICSFVLLPVLVNIDYKSDKSLIAETSTISKSSIASIIQYLIKERESYNKNNKTGKKEIVKINDLINQLNLLLKDQGE